MLELRTAFLFLHCKVAVVADVTAKGLAFSAHILAAIFFDTAVVVLLSLSTFFSFENVEFENIASLEVFFAGNKDETEEGKYET